MAPPGLTYRPVVQGHLWDEESWDSPWDVELIKHPPPVHFLGFPALYQKVSDRRGIQRPSFQAGWSWVLAGQDLSGALVTGTAHVWVLMPWPQPDLGTVPLPPDFVQEQPCAPEGITDLKMTHLQPSLSATWSLQALCFQLKHFFLLDMNLNLFYISFPVVKQGCY